MKDGSELLDVVNDQDIVIGTILRADAMKLKLMNGRYIRAVNCFIVNDELKLWVPTRSMHKFIAPGGLDYSVGGHIPSGESYEEACLREFREEAGIIPDFKDLELISSSSPDEHSFYFSRLYALRSTAQPKLSDEHVSGE